MGFTTALLTVFICMLFGANAVAIKISLTGLGIFTTVGLRFIIATTTLTIWAIVSGKNLALERSQAYHLLTLGFIFFLQMGFFYIGQQKTTASHGTIIANILPFIVMVLAHFFLEDDQITLKKIT